MNLSKIVLLALFSSLAMPSFAQVTPFVKVSVEKRKILLGEPLLMSIEVRFPGKENSGFSMPDSITHFELLDKPLIDSVNEGGIIVLKGQYKITSFDSGHWVIPPYTLTRTVKSDTIGIDVVFSEFNPEQPYHDIKDIIEVKAKEKKQWWWYAAGGALLLVMVVIYLLRKKRPVPVIEPVIKTDPYDEAMRQLQSLQKTRPESKQYYSELTNIFRLYIFRRKGILSLQKTTDDLVLQLKAIDLPKNDFEKLSQALRLSDFVKFAKYMPTPEDDDAAYNEILSAIKTIEESGSNTPSLRGS